MKLPVVWIVAALVAGIALVGPHLVSPMAWFALALAAILASLGLLRRRWRQVAWVFGLLAWVFLGAAAARLEQLAKPAEHITTLLAAGRLDTSEALRWRGRVREDPSRLPWGLRYDVDLEEVESAGKSVPVTGGLRVSYFTNDRGSGEASLELPPAVRAGDRVEALVRARQPRNFLNPGGFDFRAYLARQDIHLTGSLRSAELLRKLAEPPPTLAHRLARIRGRLLDRLDAMFFAAPDQAAVLRAMLLGDRNFIDHERVVAFQKGAAYHVLVIAGLHVGALAAFALWAGRRLRLSLLGSALLTVAVLAAYVGIVEDRPPILRAALMAALFLCGRIFYRRVDLLNTTALAALVILAARPSSLADPSFQLSFLAVGSIGALSLPWISRSSEPYRRALEHLEDVTRDGAHNPLAVQFRLDVRATARWLTRRLPVQLARLGPTLVTLPCRGALRLWEVFLLSATIQLGMLPLLAHYFHRVSLAGPLVNIPAVLLTGLIVPLGFLALGASLVWAAVGSTLGRAVGALVAMLVASVEWFARWNWTSYRIPGPPAWLLGAFFLALVLLAFAAHATRKRWQLLLAPLLAALGLAVATYPFRPSLERGKLEVAVLDVGQGDSLFAAFPDGRTMLVDGGSGSRRVGKLRLGVDIGEQVVSPYLWSRGLKRLDVVALTHAHQDHLGGLDAVIENFRVRELWVGHEVASRGYRALLEHAQALGVRVLHRVRGEAFAWDGVAGHFLWPDSSDEVQSPKNNDSLVLRLEYGRVNLLLPGDIERTVEHGLVTGGEPLAADFLKIAHHGSKTSTSAELLGSVSPRVAAVSVGETNPFGHPSAEVLERLRALGVHVLRTDRNGAITVLSDGQTLRVRCFAEQR